VGNSQEFADFLGDCMTVQNQWEDNHITHSVTTLFNLKKGRKT